MLAHGETHGMSVSFSGGKSFVLGAPNQYETKEELGNVFSEAVMSVALKKELLSKVSVFGKVLHYSGEAQTGHVWDRNKEVWVEIESPLSTKGTWVGGGLMGNTNRNHWISAGFGLGYGYLDNPQNIHNSGHGQFNVTADLTVMVARQWAITTGWEHISNGRRFFRLGEKDSDFYPNNGRDFWTLGTTYRF